MPDVVRTVGRYEIVGELGRGGMAVVYLARQTDLDRHVALKELRAFRAGDPELVQRFVREARLAGSLTHWNIVVVHDFFEYDGLPYIAMELVEGGSLRPHIGRMSLAQMLGVVEGMLAGIGYAASRGLVHRDIKPENVLVGSGGHVKIADFGIARARDQLWGATLTDTGVAVGTPAYMAPEQATGGDIGPSTDLYAVGAVAYEMVTGRLPFAGKGSHAAALLALVAESAPSPRTAAPNLDAGIAEWIQSMLARDPAARPADAAAAWDALEQHATRLFGARWRLQAPLAGGATTRGVAALAPPSTSAPWRGASAPTPPGTAVAAPLAPVRPAFPAPAVTLGASAKRSSGARFAAGALAAAVVAAAGLGTALALPADHHDASTAGHATTNADFALRLPDGWRRIAKAPRVPGVALKDPLAVARAKPAATSLVAGFANAEGPALLALDEHRVTRPERDPDVVALGALQALRYRDLSIADRPATRLTLYAVPSDHGVATLACVVAPEADASSLVACERVASTLELRSAHALPVGPSAGYARSVRTILGRLGRARRRAGRALASATTAPAQASAAASVGRTYAITARALAVLRVRPADRPGNDRLASALRRAQHAFAALSSSARSGSPGRYRNGAREVAGAVAGVDRAIARLRSAGYTVGRR